MGTITPFHISRLPDDIPPMVGDLSAHVYFNDFDHYVAGDWTITTTETGAGSATEALTNADHGVLLITNDAADDDADFFQKVGESFKFATGYRTWFAMRFKVSDATQSDVVLGLQITDTTPLAVTDGVYFLKSDGDTMFDFLVTKDSTSTTSAEVATLADDTWIVLGFYYDGASLLVPYVDGQPGTPVAITNLPDDEDLTVSFGIQNGEAVAKTMSVDYIYAAKER
jgi:hypothetical protein